MKIIVKHRLALKRIRAMQGYTQKEFAKKIGISRERVNALENKQQEGLSINTANKIINVLNCEWSDIFEFTE